MVLEPEVEDTVNAGRTYDPAVLALTDTLTVQVLLPLITPPAQVREFPLAAAVTVPEPSEQITVGLGEDVFVRPAGYVTENPILLGLPGAALLTVIVSLDATPAWTEVGENAADAEFRVAYA